MPVTPIVLKATDFAPLLADPTYMKGTIDALDQAMRAEYESRIRQRALADETGEGDAKSTLSFNFITTDGQPAAVTVAGSGGGATSRFAMLFDESTRGLLAIMDVSPFNPVRVGAEGALGCRYLATPGAKTLGMIGSARQARTQMAAICNELPGLETIRVFSRTKENREKFCSEMSAWLGRDIRPVDSVREAIEDADIVDLVNNSNQPIFELEWIKPGALVLTISGRGELPLSFLSGPRVIAPVWDIFSKSLVRDPFGVAIRAGTYTKEDYAGDLGAVIKGEIPARMDPDEIVDFEATAVPSLEHATNVWAYNWARATGAGTSISLA